MSAATLPPFRLPQPVPPVLAATRISVRGVVQGVGFRPFVHRLALRTRLTGWVRNASGDVQIHVEGAPDDVTAFIERLKTEAPPLAQIDELRVEPCQSTGLSAFTILESRSEEGRRQPISPDVALCAACETELFDVENRRYRYPFITCTDCGPRFTVIEAMPYDRERTSMRAFTQCAECQREYETPGDRRYHSETNSCPECGPHLRLESTGSGIPGLAPGVSSTSDALQATTALLLAGRIVAIRGLGGFHLAGDATNDSAVARLRARKEREAKPFAVMVRTLAEARQLGAVNQAEASLLTSRERPIVLLRKRRGSALAHSVAPGLDTVGVMLAYTPLHHLLCDLVRRPLVMTSGNRSEEPIAISNEDATARLATIADAFLLHDRDIVARYDDSVVRVAGETTVFLRRARGYAPLPLKLPLASPKPLVAVGPHLKNTFTLVQGADAYVSQHIGDLENLETLTHWRAAFDAYRRLFRLEPEVAVRDLHPGYMSTRIAGDLGLERVIPVQHHHAHIAAVLAEHRVTTRALGVAFDGTGYGDDGNIWGAEFLLCDLADYRRVGQLRYARLPGGDLAARQPWRAALGYLALDPDAAHAFGGLLDAVHHNIRNVALQQMARRLNAPLASSMGRLFDAAGAVLGVSLANQYEGQTAMQLEALAGTRHAQPFPFPMKEADGMWLLDPLPLLIALGEERTRGTDIRELAARFHESIAAGADQLAARLAADAGVGTIALAGGCFQNARLLMSLTARLEARGLRVLVPRRLSPNDGAVSYGQAAVAAALLLKEDA
ncbi:MAG TPA: carbamoyltransferase HypF [Gemmatimonadales bacterium]|nr:carbamoyltransferase HypF [Gemmatimonadales bacterium]